MNAKQARDKYFELYVEFEHWIRLICQQFQIKTRNVSLNKLITKLSNENDFPAIGITAKTLRKQLQIRNWLAHMHSNAKVPNSYVVDFNEIEGINNLLKAFHSRNKKTASERGRAKKS